MHRLRLLDPEREASKARDASREHDEMAARQRLEHRVYDEFMHREFSWGVDEKLHAQFGPCLQIASTAGVKGKLSFSAPRE